MRPISALVAVVALFVLFGLVGLFIGLVVAVLILVTRPRAEAITPPPTIHPIRQPQYPDHPFFTPEPRRQAAPAPRRAAWIPWGIFLVILVGAITGFVLTHLTPDGVHVIQPGIILRPITKTIPPQSLPPAAPATQPADYTPPAAALPIRRVDPTITRILVPRSVSIMYVMVPSGIAHVCFVRQGIQANIVWDRGDITANPGHPKKLDFGMTGDDVREVVIMHWATDDPSLAKDAVVDLVHDPLGDSIPTSPPVALYWVVPKSSALSYSDPRPDAYLAAPDPQTVIYQPYFIPNGGAVQWSTPPVIRR